MNPWVAGGPGGALQYGNVLPERGTLIALEEHKRVGFLRIKAKKTEREKLTYEPKCFCKHEAEYNCLLKICTYLRLGVWTLGQQIPVQNNAPPLSEE